MGNLRCFISIHGPVPAKITTAKTFLTGCYRANRDQEAASLHFRICLPRIGLPYIARNTLVDAPAKLSGLAFKTIQYRMGLATAKVSWAP